MPDDYCGSEWRHWDLHVHTPFSYHNEFPGTSQENKWERYLEALSDLDGVQVLGITDYCSVEGYLRVRQWKDEGNLPDVDEILPNVEFRLRETTRDGRNINIHVIASPEIAGDLPALLLSRLHFGYNGEEYSCRHDDLVRLGRAFRGDPDLEEYAAFCVGAEQFKVSLEDLKKAFERSNTLRQNALIVLPNHSGDGGSGLRESGQQAMREGIYQVADAIFSGNPADREHFLGLDGKVDVVATYDGRMPCIHGSDAHSLEEIGRPDMDRFTWIKADPSFDGLLQICYEPEFRVRIAADKPTGPIHRIDGATLNVPPDAVMKSPEGDDPFCLRGETKLRFASGLTCIIGGRGSGKSTLLSLLQVAATGESEFFSDKQIVSAGDELEIEELVSLDVSSTVEGIDFLDQNQIEEFAVDHKRLTEAVYSRLQKLDRTGGLDGATERLKEEVALLQELQEVVVKRHQREADLGELRDQEAAINRLIASLNDDDYRQLVQRTEALSKQASEIRRARTALSGLADRLETAIEADEPGQSSGSVTTAGGPAAEYQQRASTLRESVRTAVRAAVQGEDLSELSDAERQLVNELAEVNEEIQQYLEGRGISEENARDLTNASEQLTEVRSRIAETEQTIAQLKQKEEATTEERTPEAREEFETALEALITPINGELAARRESELRRISIEYRFDREAAIESCQRHLIEVEASSNEDARKLRPDHVVSACAPLDWEHLPESVDELDEVLDFGQAGDNETAKRLLAFLNQPGEYERFRLLVETRLADALRFKRVQLLYDGKRLERASFGQRCSAALIILLMLGNKPVVIDEPEAHLDSALIGSLLVDLIKRRMSERQIIFATHNANFVVNGDSELIHVLSLEGEEPTHVESTSLEDKSHRREILQLEGGSEAFAKREQRYGFGGRFLRPVEG